MVKLNLSGFTHARCLCFLKYNEHRLALDPRTLTIHCESCGAPEEECYLSEAELLRSWMEPTGTDAFKRIADVAHRDLPAAIMMLHPEAQPEATSGGTTPWYHNLIGTQR